ncbi:hypothetical protein B0T22DRAFT_242381 [Podospora appendiculata]|uniref:F-box domain-containing protein n=1 Tax=Podospora appendiculata TaxID=314037 RepID=A0AAE0X784_9PEZI|nr:hypothetical protein B0T22DRAFT_242381 [Podospora appendiculata]
MASLMSMPTELLLDVANNLKAADDHIALAALAKTCRRLRDIAEPILHKLASKKHPQVLFWACTFGYERLVGKLLDAGSGPNIRIYFKDTELINRAVFAIPPGRFYSVLSNVAVRVGREHDTYICATPLHAAAKIGRLSIATMLAARVDYFFESSQGFCGCKNSFDITVRGPSCNAFHVATCHGHVQLAEFLLKQMKASTQGSPDPDYVYRFALEDVAYSGSVPMLDMMLSTGRRSPEHLYLPDARGLSPLFIAHIHDHMSLIEAMRGYGVNLENTPDHGFHYGPLIEHFRLEEQERWWAIDREPDRNEMRPSFTSISKWCVPGSI